MATRNGPVGRGRILACLLAIGEGNRTATERSVEGLGSPEEDTDDLSPEEGRATALPTNWAGGMGILMAETYYISEGGPHVQPTTELRDTITNRGWEGGVLSYPFPQRVGARGMTNKRNRIPRNYPQHQ